MLLFSIQSRVLVVIGVMALTACAEQPEALDVCDRAAEHRAACVGEYVTPPVCDADAEQAADYLLSLSCDEINHLGADGKADGAFCDWLGAGCTADEPILTGSACTSNASCATGSSCLEGHCFANNGSELAAIMDRWTHTAETLGSTTQLLDQNSEARTVRNQLMAG